MAKKRYHLLAVMTWIKNLEYDTDEELSDEPTPRQKALICDAAREMLEPMYGAPDNLKIVVGTEEVPVLFTINTASMKRLKRTSALSGGV